jgi:hypothetical protein
MSTRAERDRALLGRMDELWHRTYWHHTEKGESTPIACANANEAINSYYQVMLFIAQVDKGD